jgi:hypothetical protein
MEEDKREQKVLEQINSTFLPISRRVTEIQD